LLDGAREIHAGRTAKGVKDRRLVEDWSDRTPRNDWALNVRVSLLRFEDGSRRFSRQIAAPLSIAITQMERMGASACPSFGRVPLGYVAAHVSGQDSPMHNLRDD